MESKIIEMTEDLQFDTETGEIIEPDFKWTEEDIPRISRRMGYLADETNEELKAVSLEIDKLTQAKKKHKENFEQQKSFWESVLYKLLRNSGKDKIKIPGVCLLSTVNSRKALDMTTYEEMGLVDKNILQDKYPHLFDVKEVVTVKPEAKKIFEILDGKDVDITAEEMIHYFTYKPNDISFRHKRY